MGKIKQCPFCGGEASPNLRYWSDNNHPDGGYHFVECDDCGAKSEEFYAVWTHSMHLSKKQQREQDKFIEQAEEEAAKVWNRRTNG